MYADEELLQYVDINALRSIAQERGISFPSDCTKEEIIRIILNERQRFQDTLRSVIHLELSQTKSELSSEINNVVEKGIDKGLRASSHHRASMSLVLAAIATLLSIAGFVGYIKISDIDKTRMNLDKAIENANINNTRMYEIISRYYNLVIQGFIDDTKKILTPFSMTLPKKEALKSIENNKKRIENFVEEETLKGQQNSEEYKILVLIQNVNQAIISIGEASKKHLTNTSKARTLRSAITAWEKLSTKYKFKNKIFSDYVEDIKKFRLNALGIFKLIQHQRSGKSAMDFLNAAEKDFTEALGIDGNYTRAKNSKAIVYGMKFELRYEQNAPFEELNNYLEEGTRLLRETLSIEGDKKVRSSTTNNIANFSKLKAKLYLEEKIENPIDVIEKALKDVRRAKAEDERTPILLVTEAELLCTKIWLNKDRINELYPEKEDKEKVRDEVLSLMRIAISDDSRIFDETDKEKFRENNPELFYLEYLGISFENLLFETVGIDK